MNISSNTQSFSSLNGVLKVNYNNSQTQNSNTQTKLSDAVSVNISSSAAADTTSLLNSLKEETVIQARNVYVNPDEAKQIKMLEDYYSKMNEENKMFANPYDHIDDKYNSPISPYYIKGLTAKERETASSTERQYLDYGRVLTYSPNDAVLRNEQPIYGNVEVAEEKAFNREKVNTQFQSLLNKYNLTIPQDTKLSFTIDPNTLKATVSGTDDKTLAKSVEDVINTANNATELFYHITSSALANIQSLILLKK